MAAQVGSAAWMNDIYRQKPATAPVAKQISQFWRWASEPASVGMLKSFGRGTQHSISAIGMATGGSYIQGLMRHTVTPASYSPAIQKVFGITPELLGQTGFLAKHMPITKRAMSAAGVALTGMMGPGFIIGFGAMSPHGMAVGMVEETAGFIVGGFAMPPAIVAGKIAGRAIGSSIGAGLVKRTPFLRWTPGALTTAARAGLGTGAVIGSVAGFALGIAAWEAARWSVGFALHTLPTFARQFQSDMQREGFGGDYTDSQGAATMRARSLQVMGKSFANARSALGQEAALMHV
ncbi:MAG: hypothetical protein GQ553_02040 [Nitrosomonadaceae bacterium]|nr:hypothetical protein [Nitrosomonadaceae bacterium]